MADNDLDKHLEGLGIDLDADADVFEPSVPEASGLEPSLPVPGIVSGEPKQRCESFLVNLLLNIDPAYAVEVYKENDRELSAEIIGGNSGQLIGKSGKTLQALEYITNAVINSDTGASRIHVDVDVAGYKRRRDDRLRELANKTADRVRKSGKPIELDPMTAAERRVVHIELARDRSVLSESTGKGSDRRVVVKPS